MYRLEKNVNFINIDIKRMNIKKMIVSEKIKSLYDIFDALIVSKQTTVNDNNVEKAAPNIPYIGIVKKLKNKFNKAPAPKI